MRGDAPPSPRERRSLSLDTARSEVASHATCEIAADREAEPRAADGASVARPHLHEGLEDRLELLAGDPDPGVRDLEEGDVRRSRPVPARRERHDDLSAGWG